VLTTTTSCDAGVRVDLSCDSCDVLFVPRASTPQIPKAIWAAAAARGWSPTGAAHPGRHLCPECAVVPRDGRLAEAAPGVS
jgi:hypothetical protein